MAFKPKESTGTFDRDMIPEGPQEAYCYGVVDCGTHARKPYLGVEKNPAPLVMLFFEFPEHTKVFKEERGEEPMVKSQRYTFTSDEKGNLSKMLKGWVGDIATVDFAKLPGTPASITIKHEASKTDATKVYDNMVSISPLSPKLVPLMKPMTNKPMVFSIDDDGFDSEAFSSLYDWVKTFIAESAEYKEYLSGPKSAKQDNDVPFNE